MYAVTSMPLDSRTRATFRSAEFGFFGVVVYTRVHTPRRWGEPFSAGVLFFDTLSWRPLRTSWLMVGTAWFSFLLGDAVSCVCGVADLPAGARLGCAPGGRACRPSQATAGSERMSLRDERCDLQQRGPVTSARTAWVSQTRRKILPARRNTVKTSPNRLRY